MDVRKQIEYWRSESDGDWESVQRLVSHGTDLHWALFILHLSVEKTLKAVVTSRQRRVPTRTHNLVTLARETGLDFTEAQLDLLSEANRFNLESRYPEYQAQLRAVATPEFVSGYLQRLGEIRRWILQQL